MGCSVVGALVRQGDPRTLEDLEQTFRLAKNRGPDSAGLWVQPWDLTRSAVEAYSTGGDDPAWPAAPAEGFTWVANRRGEPTTEYVENKRVTDVQPFISRVGGSSPTTARSPMTWSSTSSCWPRARSRRPGSTATPSG